MSTRIYYSCPLIIGKCCPQNNKENRRRVQTLQRPNHTGPREGGNRESLCAQPKDLVQEMGRDDRQRPRVWNDGGRLERRSHRGGSAL